MRSFLFVIFIYLKHNRIMRQRKYTLPRHTNLASQGSRIGAFLIDLAISFALLLGFLFGCFRFVFLSKTSILDKKIYDQRIASHLFFENEKGELDYYTSSSNNEDFKNALCAFYTLYLPYEDVDKDIQVTLEDGSKVNKAVYFTIEWFNENVLKVSGDGSTLFEYKKAGEEPIKSELALIKADVPAEAVNTFLQKAWLTANSDFNKLPSFKKLNNECNFYYSIEFVLAGIIGFGIVYIVLPLILKNGVTPGKKAFGLCLATSDGYLFNNYQLAMRIMPLYVVLLAMLIPIWGKFFTIMIVFLAIFMVSFTLAMASPKRSSLHDFTGRTIVVNAKTSILFKDQAEEEEYIAKEDNLIVEEVVKGEEPELKYEK